MRATAIDRNATDADQRWQIVLRRNPAPDENFFYAVKTTGVYCRPGCSARPPKRSNVEFFDSPEEARRAGYRPCKKCSPEGPPNRQRRAFLIEQTCRKIEQAGGTVTLAELARASAMSPGHLQRLFKEVVGLTPKQYAVSQRTRRFRASLETEDSVTGAIYGAGYGSSSRAYEGVSSRLGMSPSKFQSGGQGLAIRYAVASCFLGSVLVAMTERGVCAIEFGDDAGMLAGDLRRRFPKAEIHEAGGDLKAAVAAVIRMLESPGQSLELPLDIQGTAFQQRVWNALRDIPPGKTAAYAEVAKRIGDPNASRAVAAACAANPLAVAVPCHRVVAARGGLGGYRWGVERKRELLRREAKPDRKP